MKRKGQDPRPAISRRAAQVIGIIRTSDGRMMNEDEAMRSIGAYGYQCKRWREGVNYPTIEQVYNICSLYKVSAQWLIMGIGEPFGRHDEIKELRRSLENIEKTLTHGRTVGTRKRL